MHPSSALALYTLSLRPRKRMVSWPLNIRDETQDFPLLRFRQRQVAWRPVCFPLAA